MPEITAPNAQAYGTYEQALAQMLQGGGQIAGPLNQLALNGYARQQRGQYDLALQRTQALQQQEMQRAAEAELEKTYLQQIAPMASAGVSSAVPGSQYGVDTILPMLQAADNSVINKNEADALLDRSGAVSNMAGVGLLPNAVGTSDILFEGGIQSPENEPLMPYMSPDATNDATRAAASMKSADASMINAARGPSSGGGDGTQYETVTYEDRDKATGNVTKHSRRVPIANNEATAQPSSGTSNATAVVAAFRQALQGSRQPPPR